MVLHNFSDIGEMFYEEFIFNILTDSRKDVRDDNDILIIIAGRPGVGKSVLAMQIAKLLDPEFNIEQVVFRSEDLIKKSLELGKFRAIMWDEAREGISSDQALSKKNKVLMDFMAEARQRNQFHIWCMPDFWEFQMPIATRRSDFFISVYKEPNTNYQRESNRSNPFTRGHYEFYGFEQKRRLYVDGKKYHNYTFSGSHGRYSGKYVVDPDEYKKRKQEAIRVMGKPKANTIEPPAWYIKQTIIRLVEMFPTTRQADIAHIVDRSQSLVWHYMHEEGEPTTEESVDLNSTENVDLKATN